MPLAIKKILGSIYKEFKQFNGIIRFEGMTCEGMIEN